MKSNINMTNGVVKSGEFTYCRTPRVLKAYGQEFNIPVRTVAFDEKLNTVSAAIAETTTTSDTVKEMLNGVALFIGEEETEKLFPAEKLDEIDVDEILAFWQALNFELKRAQNELMAKYRPAPNVRR